MGVVFELLPHVLIQPQILEEIIPLENRMVLHHPMVSLTDVGLKQDRSDICMVGRPQRITYVM